VATYYFDNFLGASAACLWAHCLWGASRDLWTRVGTEELVGLATVLSLVAIARPPSEMREVSDDEPRLAGAEVMQVLKHELAIVERAKRVDQRDVIERTRQRFNKAGCFDVACIERIARMGPPRFLNRRGAQIDIDAPLKAHR
jgi:hypothetical protein